MNPVNPSRIPAPRLGFACVCAGASAILAVVAFGVLSEYDPFGIVSAPLACFAALPVCLFLLWKPSNTYRGLGIYFWTGLVATVTVGVWAFTDVVIPWLWALVLFGSLIGLFAVVHDRRTMVRAGALMWNPTRPVPPAGPALIGLLLLAVAFALGLAGFVDSDARTAWARDDRTPWVVLAFTVAFMIYATARLFRPAFEWFFVISFGTMYHMRGKGPGFAAVPPVGPMILLANHGGYFDPVVLQKVTDRPVTGMMSSLYYDRWFVKLLSNLIFKTIRVPDATARHEAPELREAVAALDRGECVMIFPEGWLRRKEDVPLKRFGQGIWQILRDRPDTPVVCCWIEGTWGSLFSFKNGPPLKGKGVDLWRTVDVGVNTPVLVPPDVLANHWDTRFFLMNEVSAARVHVGLEPLPRFERTGHDTE